VLLELPPTTAVMFALSDVLTLPPVALNVATLEPAVMVTDAGTVSSAMLFVKEIVVVAEAGLARLTVHVLEPPGTRFEGLQTKDDTDVPGTSVRETLWLLAPSAAVITAFCVLATLPAVTVKAAETDPVETITDAGAARAALSSDRAIVVSDGAAAFSEMVHVLELPDPNCNGLHANNRTAKDCTTTRPAVRVLVPVVARTATICGCTTAPTFAVKVAVEDPAGTVTDAGTLTPALVVLNDAVTGEEVEVLRVNVHELFPPGTTLGGVQSRDVRDRDGRRERDAVFELLPSIAVTTAV
jgi:hypothetical protein